MENGEIRDYSKMYGRGRKKRATGVLSGAKSGPLGTVKI
jgi:hypothetical protein